VGVVEKRKEKREKRKKRFRCVRTLFEKRVLTLSQKL
jgi:hypothetical protein